MLKFKELEEKDLKSAIEHGASEQDLYNCPYHLEFLEPLALLEDLGLHMEASNETEVSKIVDFIISQGNDPNYDWAGLLTNPVPPVVIVNDTLMDGIHRCIAAVASKSLVKAVVFAKDLKN